jgi:hypothetical protein
VLELAKHLAQIGYGVLAMVAIPARFFGIEVAQVEAVEVRLKSAATRAGEVAKVVPNPSFISTVSGKVSKDPSISAGHKLQITLHDETRHNF